MTETCRAVAADLLRIGAVLIQPDDPFTWASGIQSPIYTDNRLALGHPDVRRRLRDAFAATLRQHEIAPDVIAGTATAGIPHAAWLADHLDLPMVYVRSKPKGHGRGNQIEGPLHTGQSVVVVEDLVSTGGSSLDAVAALREAGAEVRAVLAIFSYGLERAHRAFADAEVPLHVLTDLDALLGVAVEEGRLDPSQREAVGAWRGALNNAS